jgi:citrate synthase
MIEDKDHKIARPRQVYLGAEKREYVAVEDRLAREAPLAMA